MPSKLVHEKLTKRLKTAVPERFQREREKEPESKEVQLKSKESQPKIKRSKIQKDQNAAIQAQLAASVKSQTAAEIEEVLADGLEEVYHTLDVKEKKEFRKKGEETAGKLEEMFKTFKVRAKEVLVLIKDWLMLIPQINKYFLEQQSKIKTDQVLELAQKYKNKK